MEETGGKSLWEVNGDRLLLWNQLFFQISLGMHQCWVLRLTSRLRNLGCVCTAINLCCCAEGVELTSSSPENAHLPAQPGQHSTGVPGHSSDIRTCCWGIHLTFQTGFCSSCCPVPQQLRLPDTPHTQLGTAAPQCSASSHGKAVLIRGSSWHQRRAARKSLTPVLSFLYRRGCLW